MLYLYVYGGALLSLLVTFALARHFDPQVFQATALGLTAGGFGAVLCNLGSDLAQLNSLLALPTHAGRTRLVLRNLAARAAILAVLLVLLLAYAWRSFPQAGLAATAAIHFGWMASIGLQPNGYADYLQAQRRQQLINAAERACAIVAVGVLWQVLPGGDAIVGCATGCVLFVVRLLGTSAQWRAMMVEDRTRSAAGAAQPPQESPRARASRLHTTAAAFFNSCTAYVPVLLLDHFGHKADLALYALVQQSANVVILFQGVASRLFSRRIAEASDETGGVQVIFQAARRVGGTSALLATAGAAFTAAYLLHVGTYGTPAKVLALVAILFSWGAWLGFGQIVTRALVLGGHARAYSHAAAATVFGALVAAWALAPRFGAVGAALAIALPHSVMIAFCAFALRRNAARISSP